MKSRFAKTVTIGILALISCGANAQYRYVTNSGCKVNTHTPWPNEVKVEWVGSCYRGFASGAGNLILSAPDAPTVENSGTMEKGTKVGTWIEQRLTLDPKTRSEYVYSVSVTYENGEPKEESLYKTPPGAPSHIVDGLRRLFAEDTAVAGITSKDTSNSNPVSRVASTCPKEARVKNKPYQSPWRIDGNGLIRFDELYADGTWHPYKGQWSAKDPGIVQLYCTDPSNKDEYEEVCKMIQCFNNQGGTRTPETAGKTKAQINVGGAREAVVGKGVSKNASSSKTQSECNQDAKSFIKKSGGSREIAIANLKKMVADARANKSGEISKLPKDEREEMLSFMDKEAADLINGMNSCTESDLASIKPKSKYVSKDATHCVEIVPKGFKCDGPYDRFLTNICMTKISVQWRLGSDPWGMQELAPKGCTPVSPFEDPRGVQFKACSWDPKANHGPYSDPCRY